MITPTIRDHALYKRIKRKLIALSRSDMSPAVEEGLIDIELAVWFLELAIEGNDYAIERLCGFAEGYGSDATNLCGMVSACVGTNDPPVMGE